MLAICVVVSELPELKLGQLLMGICSLTATFL